MSEEAIKQEGDFKVKKPKAKNLGKTDEITKVEIPNTAPEAQGKVIPDVTKVEIKNEDNAVQEQSTVSDNPKTVATAKKWLKKYGPPTQMKSPLSLLLKKYQTKK
jgi:hypothetical protein